MPLWASKFQLFVLKYQETAASFGLGAQRGSLWAQRQLHAVKGGLGPIETPPLLQAGSSTLSAVTFSKKGAEPHFLGTGSQARERWVFYGDCNSHNASVPVPWEFWEKLLQHWKKLL